MNGYAVFWIVFAVILGVIETQTVNLVTIWFGLGALVSCIVSLFVDSVLIQSCVFVGVSVVSLVLTRPLVRKYMNGKTVATNADRFINQKASVVRNINSISGSGQIKTMGQIWSAKSVDGQDINEGEEVIINRIEGVRAVVSKVE
ncbi:MAG: NfeD family protein [Ruminococcaceae bacterium]|nr:NfeD family protein [Oscillospiraceae bacterium]